MIERMVYVQNSLLALEHPNQQLLHKCCFVVRPPRYTALLFSRATQGKPLASLARKVICTSVLGSLQG